MYLYFMRFFFLLCRRSPSSNEQSSHSRATLVCESACDGSTLLPDHTLPGIFAVTSPSFPRTAVESHPVRTENQTPDHFVSQLTSLTPVSDQQNDGVEVRSMYADSHVPVSLLNKQVTLIHHSEESHDTSQVPDSGPSSDRAVFEPNQASCSLLSALKLSQCMPNSAAVTDSISLDVNNIVEGSQIPTDSVVAIESCRTSSETSSSFIGPSLHREISPTTSVIDSASPFSSPVTLDLPNANVDEPLDQSCMIVEPSVASPKDAKSVQHSGISSFYKFFSGRAGSLVQRLCKVLISADSAEYGADTKRLATIRKNRTVVLLSHVSLSQLVRCLLHRIRDSVRYRCRRWKHARLIRKAVPSWIQSPRSGLIASFSAGWPSLSSSFSNHVDEYEPCLSPGSVDLQLAQTTPSIQSLPSRLPTLLVSFLSVLSSSFRVFGLTSLLKYQG
ncbi:hypothetical protein AHF37_07955 [Paragonimus kellicotti]|nr:hypothetical protein AHF37_07955 [Paragonimus kellicotti]